MRVGTQLGVGTAIDQTIRHFDPNFPTILSEEAIKGTPEFQLVESPPVIDLSIELADDVELDHKIAKNEQWNTVKAWGAGLVAVAVVIAAARFAPSRAIKMASQFVPFGAGDSSLSAVYKFMLDLKAAKGSKSVHRLLIKER